MLGMGRKRERQVSTSMCVAYPFSTQVVSFLMRKTPCSLVLPIAIYIYIMPPHFMPLPRRSERPNDKVAHKPVRRLHLSGDCGVIIPWND